MRARGLDGDGRANLPHEPVKSLDKLRNPSALSPIRNHEVHALAASFIQGGPAQSC
jgi:hypothetical protein